MSLKKTGLERVKGWLLQFKVIFGLAFSVVTGFMLGYLLGGYRFRAYFGLGGTIVGFLIGLVYLIRLAKQDEKQ